MDIRKNWRGRIREGKETSQEKELI